MIYQGFEVGGITAQVKKQDYGTVKFIVEPLGPVFMSYADCQLLIKKLKTCVKAKGTKVKAEFEIVGIPAKLDANVSMLRLWDCILSLNQVAYLAACLSTCIRDQERAHEGDRLMDEYRTKEQVWRAEQDRQAEHTREVSNAKKRALHRKDRASKFVPIPEIDDAHGLDGSNIRSAF